KGLWDKQGKVRVSMSSLLEHSIQHPLHVFPDGVSVGTDHHAALDVRVVGQARLEDEVHVPFGKPLFSGDKLLCHSAILAHVGQRRASRGWYPRRSMPHILVVDDNQELLVLMARLLEDAGYQVISANRGRAAIDVARSKPPALAVIDLLLPDMMGQQVAETLRRDNPKLPLIFVTGVFKAGRHALEARGKFGPVGYFEKPFESQKLLEAVKKQISLETARAPAAEDPFNVELDVSVQENDPSPSTMELPGVIKVTGTDNLVAEIRGANRTASRVVPEAQPIARPAAVAPAPSSRPAPARAGASQRGQLKDNLPSLITAFYLSGQTGELGVQRGKVKKVIYFLRGQPAFAMSNLLSERFGQFLSRVGKLKPEQLHEVLAAAH